ESHLTGADANGGRAGLVSPAAAAPSDELPELVVADVAAQVLVPRDDLLADPLQLVRGEAGVDAHVPQRAVQPVHVLAHAEALAVERSRDVEYAVAHQEAAIHRIDLHLAERHELPIEVRDIIGHDSSSPALPARSE